jgi:hypothetical protein
MNIFLSSVALLHLVIGSLFCKLTASWAKVNTTLINLIFVTLTTSVSSIATLVALFLYTPLQNLPGGFMDGAVGITLPIAVIIFTSLYLCISYALWQVIVSRRNI